MAPFIHCNTVILEILLVSSLHGHFEIVSLLLDTDAATCALLNGDDDEEEEEVVNRKTALHFAVIDPSHNKARVASLLPMQTYHQRQCRI
jgi:hypothetical protein